MIEQMKTTTFQDIKKQMLIFANYMNIYCFILGVYNNITFFTCFHYFHISGSF